MWFGLQVQTMPRHLTGVLLKPYAPRMAAELQLLRIDYRSVLYAGSVGSGVGRNLWTDG